jgi:putative transposase
MSESAKYDPARHHRRSIRLKGHDYAGGGLYFVTICAHREAGAIFSTPVAREILSRIWEEICLQAEIQGLQEGQTQGLQEGQTQGLQEGQTQGLQEGQTQGLPVRARLACAALSYCIMPDHFHGLIRIAKGKKSLGDFICAFKSRTTHECRKAKESGKFPLFENKIWHRNYYEVIVRSREAEEHITEYIRMNPWRCVQELGSGLRGMGNPALWHEKKLGVLCSRNAPKIGRLPEAAVYFGGWHSPKEKEILSYLLAHKKRVIACPAWGIERTSFESDVVEALEDNRMLVLEMRDQAGDLASAEARNRFVMEQADSLFTPYVAPGGMLERMLKAMGEIGR